jgi:hypothetical protein
MSENTPQEPRPIAKKALLEDSRFALYGPPVDGGPAPCLKFSIMRGMPAITLFTNEDGNGPDTRIRAAMGPVELAAFLEMLQDCAAAVEPVQFEITCSNRPKEEGGERSKEVLLMATVVVGRRRDGMVYLGIKSADSSKPVREFPMQLPNPRFHSINIKTAGEKDNVAAKMSQLCARAWARAIDRVAYPEMNLTYEKPEFQGAGGQRPGGFGNRQGGQGGGYRQGGGYGQRNGQGGGGGGYNNRQSGQGGGYNRPPQQGGQGGGQRPGGYQKPVETSTDGDIDF